jgi:hypothetical protein
MLILVKDFKNYLRIYGVMLGLEPLVS